MMGPPHSFLQHSSVAFSLAAENESGGESQEAFVSPQKGERESSR